MTGTTGSAGGGSVRDRYRVQVQDEVKQAALRQLAEGGPAAVSVNAIGRELGLSGPALYRYFPSRQALLTALTRDAYVEFADALRAATAPAPGLDPVARLRAGTAAYRRWALDHPHRYALLFRETVPGYDAHAAELVAVAQDLMAVNVEIVETVLRDAAGPGSARRSPLPPITYWARLHGLVDLELNGNFASMAVDPGPLYAYEVDQLVQGR